jgi:hypothetical protein
LPCFIGIFVEVEAIRSAPKRSNLGRNWGGSFILYDELLERFKNLRAKLK